MYVGITKAFASLGFAHFCYREVQTLKKFISEDKK